MALLILNFKFIIYIVEYFMISKKFITLFILLFLNISALSDEKITLHLDWLNQFQFAGYYIAKEKGYYKDLGLDVQIKEFPNSQNSSKNLYVNEGVYAVGKSSLILEKFNGNDLVLLSAIFQNSPLVLISLKDSNVESIKDIKNKRVMITSDAIETSNIKSLIKSQNIDLNQIIMQNHSFNIQDLLENKTDLMACYLSNEPYVLEKQNIKYNTFNPQEYGFDFYEGILYTSKKELENHPLRVQNFNSASLKGWEYAFNNIEESARIIYEKYNTQNKSLEALVYEAKVLKQFSKIDEGLLGNINPKTIDEIKRFYIFSGLNEKNNTFDTNSIIFDKLKIELNEKQKNYLENNRFTLLAQTDKIPFSFKSRNELKGIEIDLWNLISQKLSKPFNIEEVLNSDVFNIFSDSIKVSFYYSYNNKNSVNDKILSNPIAKIPIVIATKNDKNFISDLSVLKKQKIGVLKNLEIINRLKNDYPNIEFNEIESVDEGIKKLKKDEIFGLIDNLFTISHIINANSLDNIKTNTLLSHQINIFLAVDKKQNEFINIINTTINKISNDEKNNIFNNYQFIFYSNNTNYIYLLKFIIPLILLLSIFIYFNIKLNKEIKRRKEVEIKLNELANKDGLTNIYNRRKIEELCENEMIRAKRYDNIFTIIFFDINDFKIINDTLGHHIGDDVILKIAQTVNENIRISDYFGRWGGDEFLIILPQTNITQAKNVTNILEKKLKNINFKFKNDLTISCSFGLAEYEKNDSIDILLKKADEQMYIMKSLYKKRKELKI